MKIPVSAIIENKQELLNGFFGLVFVFIQHEVNMLKCRIYSAE